MSLFGKLKRTAFTQRLLEEKLYEQVAKELEAGQRRDGLWAKALANSRADESRAKALYIKYRVQSLKDEAARAVALAEEQAALAKQQEAARQNDFEDQKLREEETPPLDPSNLLHEAEEMGKRMADSTRRKYESEKKNGVENIHQYSPIERKKIIDVCTAVLKEKGCRLKSDGMGRWIIKNPSSGRKSIYTLEELVRYAKSLQ